MVKDETVLDNLKTETQPETFTIILFLRFGFLWLCFGFGIIFHVITICE